MSPNSNRSGSYRIPVALIILIVALALAGSAFASGWPPFARDDEMVVVENGTVRVLADGSTSVLDNDFDIERDVLTAILSKDVKEGTLELHKDGTFVYRHGGGKKKDDEFKYYAFDGTGSSRETKVKIKIEKSPNNPPFTTGTPPSQEAAVDEFYRLALAGYFDDLDPDDTLRFSASGLPGGNRLTINSSSGVLSGTPRDADVRDTAYRVRVTATDEEGASASLEFSLLILADQRADLQLTSSVLLNPVTVGEATQWKIRVKNLGPADLESGEVRAQWATNGPTLALVAPQDCTLDGNNSTTPSIRCPVDGLPANSTATIDVSGTQSSDGDNSLIATVVSDDPNPGNNSDLIGSVVVSAFSEGPTQIINGSGQDIASGDLNGDGAIDLVVSSGETLIYFNSGNRTVVTPGTSLGNGSGGNAVTLLDWDGDGDVDVAVAGMNSRAGRIYLNNGSGSFAKSVNLNIDGLGIVNTAAAGDLDQDGADELVLGGSGASTLVRSASVDAGFTTTNLPATSGIDASVTDLNGDGLLDIVIVQDGNRRVRLLTNSGDGKSFSAKSLDRGSVSGATPYDVDNDGDVDLLLAVDDGVLEVPESKVVYQQSGGGYSAGTILGASPLRRMLSGDIDKDGIPDAIGLNASGVHQIYRGLPSGGFSLVAEQIVSSGMQRGVLIDFNGDDSLDLIFAGANANVVEIHANNGLGRLGLGDRVPPTISLVGAASISLAAGQPYEELGATAQDDIDGDVTNRIVINSTVNTAVVGTYTVTYTAFDKATNQAAVTRTVQVGVNQGTGGGGGGAAALASLLLLFLLVALGRPRKYPV